MEKTVATFGMVLAPLFIRKPSDNLGCSLLAARNTEPTNGPEQFDGARSASVIELMADV